MSPADPTSPHSLPAAAPMPQPSRAPTLSVHTGQGTLLGNPVLTLVVTGDLDIDGAPLLHSAWETGLTSLPSQVLLDLRGVEFCNAAGLRVLAHATATSRTRGIELIILATKRLDWLLQLVGLGQGLPPRPGGTGPHRKQHQADPRRPGSGGP